MKRRTRGRSPWRGPGFCLLMVMLLAGLAPDAARAQGETQNLPEIPLTHRTPVAARYAGMGGASLTIADDHSACLANPATLGLVRGIELAAGFSHQDADREVRYLGSPTRAEYGKTRFADLGFAYPFPTYRGRFVIGFQYGRISSLDSDFYQRSPASSDQPFEEEGIYETGGLGAYAVSAALQVSPNVTLGASGIILSGDSFRERTYRYDASGGGFSDLYETTDVDISGLTGSVGALVELDPAIRFGLLIRFPESLDFDGILYEEIDGEDSAEFSITDEIDLPFRLGAGLALARQNLIVSADALFTDWTQVRFAGPVRTVDRENAYRETVDLHFGAEYLIPFSTPVRIRAGYALQPLAYRLLLTDVQARRYEEARFDRDRYAYTFGLGALLGESLTLDLAYQHGGYERSASHPTGLRYREEVTDRRVLATLTLRVN
ncbi:MAG: hypothetical protein GF346_08010 [Candidatus Eisenbacteria bacterium]|nr:hypothetical protein [Candidatus Latescibacterota bacterium]MBD3302377.1 hypothetical protein [Candidatus Eisenbacteria bacterium]